MTTNITYADKIDTTIATITSIKTLISSLSGIKQVSTNADDMLKIKEYPFVIIKYDTITFNDVREMESPEVKLFISIINKGNEEIAGLLVLKEVLTKFEEYTLNDSCIGSQILNVQSFFDKIGESKTLVNEIEMIFTI